MKNRDWSKDDRQPLNPDFKETREEQNKSSCQGFFKSLTDKILFLVPSSCIKYASSNISRSSTSLSSRKLLSKLPLLLELSRGRRGTKAKLFAASSAASNCWFWILFLVKYNWAISSLSSNKCSISSLTCN